MARSKGPQVVEQPGTLDFRSEGRKPICGFGRGRRKRTSVVEQGGFDRCLSRVAEGASGGADEGIHEGGLFVREGL